MWAHSFYPKKYKFSASWRYSLIQNLKKRKGIKKSLKKFINRYPKSFKKANFWTSTEFKKGDLFYAFGKVSLNFKGKRKRRTWKGTVLLQDKYDFDEFRDTTSIAGIANNYARILQFLKVIKPYTFKILFPIKFKN